VAHGKACLSFVLASLLFSGTSMGSARSAVDVPFEMYQQHLIVAKGSLAGLDGLHFLIDTGTIPSLVDGRIARKLRLQTIPSLFLAFGQTTRITSAAVGGLRIGPNDLGMIPAMVGDLSYLEGVQIDAIIGLDVLARTSFGIDYKARTLSFSPTGRESSTAPLQVVWPFLTVQLQIADKPVHLLVDTGSRDLVLFKSRLPSALASLPWRGEKLERHSDGLAHLRRMELRQVRLGDTVWDKLPAFALDQAMDRYPEGIDGVLGVLSLGGTRVRFDFERNELAWGK
jgi:hypothetical protein